LALLLLHVGWNKCRAKANVPNQRSRFNRRQLRKDLLFSFFINTNGSLSKNISPGRFSGQSKAI
jgi:hypothetical protein